MPKTYSAVVADKNRETHKNMGMSEHQIQLMERSKAIDNMLMALCPEEKNSPTPPRFLLREEDGSVMSRQTPIAKGERFAPQTKNTADNAAVFFENNPKGKLQIFSPEDGKPHYLSLSDDQSQLIISDEVAPPRPAPQKPSLWDRIKSIFTKVPSVEQYRKEKADYDNYKTVSDKAKGYANERAAKAAKAATEKAAKEQEKNKEVVQQSKSVEKQKEVTFENIQPKNEVAKKFFDKVNAAVAKDNRLKHAGLQAKKGMNAICGGPQTFNFYERSRELWQNTRISGMAYVTAFNLMQKYPYLLDEYKSRPANLVGKLATPSNKEFLDAVGINTKEGILESAKWTSFVESDGMNIEGDFEEMVIKNRIAPKDKLVPGKAPLQQQQPTEVSNKSLNI